MKTTKPELLDLEFRVMDAWSAYLTLAELIKAWDRMPSRIFTKVRRQHRELKPLAEGRDEDVARVVKLKAKHNGAGEPVFLGMGKVDWEDVTGAEEVREINEEKVKVKIAPIPWDEIVPEPKDEDDLGPDVINPSAVMALMDWGLIADDPSEDGDGKTEAAQGEAAAEEGE